MVGSWLNPSTIPTLGPTTAGRCDPVHWNSREKWQLRITTIDIARGWSLIAAFAITCLPTESGRFAGLHFHRASIASGEFWIGRLVEEAGAGDVFAPRRHIRLLLALAAGFKC